jgi:hypothetical protein
MIGERTAQGRLLLVIESFSALQESQQKERIDLRPSPFFSQ